MKEGKKETKESKGKRRERGCPYDEHLLDSEGLDKGIGTRGEGLIVRVTAIAVTPGSSEEA